MLETGETLKLGREQTGLSLDEVSKDLNIPVIYLEQIESGSIGSFDDIYELKEMIISYAKYLGLSTDSIINKFNEYMFDYTSRIPMDELEKAIREKEIVEENSERVYSPYTLVYEKEKTLPYIITICIILLLIIIAVIWSVKKITIDTNNSDTNSYYRIKGE